MIRTRNDKNKTMEKKRCEWGFEKMKPQRSEKMRIYHDTRWGKPEHRDRELFAMLVLEGAQAGLSWALILEKEAAYRAAFDDFDPQKVAQYGDEKVAELLQNEGIVRNKRKILAAISNAQAFLEVQREVGSFDQYIWSFTQGRVIDHHLQSVSDMPASDELSETVSRDLRRRGFKFVGPTIVYSYLQGIGVVNDHVEACAFR